MSLQHSSSNPFRPPDWRWHRARSIVDASAGNMPANRHRDGTAGFQWISKAITYMREYQAALNSETAQELLSERRPDMFWAHHIWLNSNPLKWVIEAQILARSDDHYIGFKCNTPPQVITAYEALFFNVRDKLSHRSYILNCVIGPAIHQGLSEREYNLLWKLYGYFLGPYVIDALEGKFVSPTWCNSPTAVGAAVMDDAVSTLKFKAAIAAKTVPVNQYTQIAILDAFTKFVEIERNTDSAGKAQEQILDHISAMMVTLPFNVGGRASSGLVQRDMAPIDAFDRTAIELTYEETMRLSARQPIAHQSILKSLMFPTTESTQTMEGESR